MAMERNKQQKLGEMKKLEIMKQFDDIKRRGGQISEEDMVKLGIKPPVLYSPSGDLNNSAAYKSTEGFNTAETKDEPKFGI